MEGDTAIVLRDFSDDAKKRLLRSATRRTLKKRAVLWRAGDRPDEMAVVVYGRLDIVSGRARIRSLGLGSVVGLSTIAGAAHTADVVAGEETRVLLVRGSALRAETMRDPRPLFSALATMAVWLGEATDDLAARSLPLEQRVVRVLQRNSDRREITTTHAELAAQVGASREHVSKTLERLAKTGMIRLHRGRIELVPPRERSRT